MGFASKWIVAKYGKNCWCSQHTPLIVGDSAFPLQMWWWNLTPMPPWANSRGTSTTDLAEHEWWQRQQKGRWRVLLRKSESNKEHMRTVTLACMVLHNMCIHQGDSISNKLDLTVDPSTPGKEDREEIRKLLQMTECRSSKDSSVEALLISVLSTVILDPWEFYVFLYFQSL